MIKKKLCTVCLRKNFEKNNKQITHVFGGERAVKRAKRVIKIFHEKLTEHNTKHPAAESKEMKQENQRKVIKVQ